MSEPKASMGVDWNVGTRYGFVFDEGVATQEDVAPHGARGDPNQPAGAHRRSARASPWEVASKDPPKATRGAQGLAGDVRRRAHRSHESLREVLPRHDFLRLIRYEKRRTERTKASLSIALFHFDDSRGGASGDVIERLRLIHESKRETDVLGYLSDNLFAVLLPDTNAQGTQRFVEKVGLRTGEAPFTSSTGTCPIAYLTASRMDITTARTATPCSWIIERRQVRRILSSAASTSWAPQPRSCCCRR